MSLRRETTSGRGRTRAPRPHTDVRRVGAFVCETLEARMVLSAVVNPQGILVIIGNPTADTMTVGPGTTNGTVVVSGVPGVADGTQFEGVEGVRVDLKSGDDDFTLTGNLLDPGGFSSNITVLGGNG